MPRVGALEAQRSKWWQFGHAVRPGQEEVGSQPAPVGTRVCSLSVFLFLNKVTSSSAQLKKKKHPKPMPVLAVSKVRKPEPVSGPAYVSTTTRT